MALYIIQFATLQVKPACVSRKRIQPCCHRRNHRPFQWRQLRMADIENQRNAQLATVIPRLMFDGVVEHPRLAR